MVSSPIFVPTSAMRNGVTRVYCFWLEINRSIIDCVRGINVYGVNVIHGRCQSGCEWWISLGSDEWIINIIDGFTIGNCGKNSCSWLDNRRCFGLNLFVGIEVYEIPLFFIFLGIMLILFDIVFGSMVLNFLACWYSLQE